MQSSLVKYNNPLLISTFAGGKDKKGKGKAGKSGVKAATGGPMSPTEDILNSILPPREWAEDDQLWVQYVSSNPATRSDVVNLQDALDKRLQERQARETGICPIREELYAQCFDELIRQVTIICAERGLLLLRVRDEIRMTISAYQSLYESSIAFGMRKALQAEQRRKMQDSRINDLRNGNRDLQEEIERLQQKIVQTEQKEAERREEDEKRHQEEVEFQRKTNQQLKDQLEQMLSAPKK
uniref:Inner dynein arm light chain, axonemal n=1 Tax=Chromera velia CCMP2878 TaxID=1169474 RepID=A0A0G4HRZ9_9ALVE|eukprot:Cvel_8176.t1-p1 / transcript=Cvel_8176.t1 / gene=Cvel_8176 / organism=Chromera_velia_CCMP2878 / gene_product=28 kDa inner dynein arm light chain, axonemal, putative / transcript_product=28 kDa inner dynein arm light chain, axonemal, putative / location=Cvel_scaffold445:70948-73283(-) / protein_length=239 / sequence_SO=supercontig / SO=protein_coding / is_pseudo=false